jgi:hypothetical protein
VLVRVATAIKPIRMIQLDAARYLSISPRQFQRLVEKKLVRYVTDPGGQRFYPTTELDRYLDEQMKTQWTGSAA